MRQREYFGDAAGSMLDLMFPKTCLVCGRFDHWLCAACLGRVKLKSRQSCVVCEKAAISGATHSGCRSGATIDGLLAAAHFEQLQHLLHAYKYLLIKELSAPLTAVLGNFVTGCGLRPFLRDMLLVPVPLHPRRLRYRGFNQSRLLADEFAALMSLKLDAAILARKRWSVAQVTLDKPRRRQNMQDAFIATDAAAAAGKKILLIDDIATTGATLNACAKVLKRAGARSVWALVLAHG
jgi:ComF family protein